MTVKKKITRLEFLDFLRFFAAFAVIIQHVFEKLSPSFEYFATNYFQFGIFGVIVFFLTSGFIIPVSLEKHKTLKGFWKSRLYRLFPLYIFSIITQLTLIKFNIIEGDMPTLVGFFANLFMMAKFTGQPLIIDLYWTLNIEMVFYIIVSGLFLIKKLNKTVLLAYIALVLAFLLGGVAIGILHKAGSGSGLILSIATMFVGTVFYRYMNGTIPLKQLVGVTITAFVVLFLVIYFNMYGKPPEKLTGFLSTLNAYFGAYILFIVCFCFRGISYPKPFLFLGLISYSLYLIQGSVMPIILPQFTDKAFLGSVLCISVIILVSYLTYTFIEKPFIKMGRTTKKDLPLVKEV